MAQVFHPVMNTVAKASIFGAVFIVAFVTWAAAQWYVSPYFTQVNVPREQPLQFSHEHHVSGLGIDCRYCHGSVEESSFAGIPSTKTCMSCHSQVWTSAPMLEPVRASWRTGKPIRWTRVHDLPDYAYFDHSIHVAKGVGCASCHGDVQNMALMFKANTLHMSWCLDCHREPEKFVRPRDEVFNMDWHPPVDVKQEQLGKELVREYGIRDAVQLSNCSICHR
jgi:hypothetical protein